MTTFCDIAIYAVERIWTALNKILRILKYTSWSKINLKNTNKPEFIKEAYFFYYTLTNTIFISLKNFAWTTPKKYQIADFNP